MAEIEKGEQVVVVTGASGALGGAVVDHLARFGNQVVGLDINAPGPGALVADERASTVKWLNLDLTDGAAVETAIQTVETEVGPIDGFVHCAGGFRWSKIDEISLEEIDFLVDLNLRSSLYVARSVLKAMKKRDAGRLIFISSRSTISPGAGEGAYAATKAALNALTQSLADEVKATEITVNALQPSVIDTPANREAMPNADFSTWVPREHLVDLICYLLAPQSVSISGSLIAVSGKT